MITVFNESINNQSMLFFSFFTSSNPINQHSNESSKSTEFRIQNSEQLVNKYYSVLQLYVVGTKRVESILPAGTIVNKYHTTALRVRYARRIDLHQNILQYNNCHIVYLF